MKYSILMSVYERENPIFLSLSIRSIIDQTDKTDDIVIVWDGPLPDDLVQVLEDYYDKYPGNFRFLKLKKNMGLGYALSQGINYCKYSLIARMDSDDIAVPQRMEWQLAAFEKSPQLALCGGQIEEFVSNSQVIESVRLVPTTYEEILKYAKKRNPMNHMTVMFRKEAVLEAGNYLAMDLAEDYYLWVRILAKGLMAINLSQVLVKARVGNGMFQRRGGFKYAKSMICLMNAFYKIGFINRKELIGNIIIRTAVSLLPSKIRQIIYQKGLRK